MAKTADKTTDTIENAAFPTFDASNATDQFRAVAEKGVEQSKEAFSKLKNHITACISPAPRAS